MSNLKKSYEISVWKDVQDGSSFVEQRVAIIGSDKMESLCRATSPKFVKKLNGEKQLTFKLYSSYFDPITGENTTNPFVDLIDNETKIKLKYREKWYDLIVKDVQEDSSAKTKSYTATDQFVVELSKNGYGLVLDASLMNNTGNLTELGEAILKDTDWQIEVEGKTNPKQYLEEQLIEFLYNGKTVYAFFSSCKEQPVRFQYVTELGKLNSENVYDNPVQTYIDMTDRVYTANNEAKTYGFSYPSDFEFKGITKYRATRLVYTHKSRLNPALNKIVYSYNKGAIEGYTETKYLSPNLLTNFITNNAFKSTSGWTGSCMAPVDQSEITNGLKDDFNNSRNKASVEVVAIDSRGVDLIEAFKEGGPQADEVYTSHLKVKFQTDYSILVNSGFYDNRTIVKNLAPGRQFVLLFKTNKEKSSNSPFSVKVGVADYSVRVNRYTQLQQIFIDFNSEPTYINDGEYAGYYYIIGEVPSSYSITDEKTYQKLKTQTFISGPANSEYWFEDFQIVPYVDNNGKPLLPNEQDAEVKVLNTYYYYSTSDEDNPQNPSAAGYRVSEQEYKYSAITDAPYPDYEPDYTEDKVLSIDIKQSNYFNAIQSLCETFEVWADLDISHDENGNILSKKVIFKENIEKLNYLGFKYGVNLKSAKRTIDSKAIVTKLIVADNTNEFAKNGFCSISRAGANTSGESFILDFSYYYNFGKLNKDKMHEFLYRPKEEEDTDELQGYYVQLSEINKLLDEYINKYSTLSGSLMQAESDLQVAEAGRDGAKEKYEEISDQFSSYTGYAHTEINSKNDRIEQVNNSVTLKRYLTELSEYYASWQKYSAESEKALARYEFYKNLNDELLNRINALNIQKEELNKKFYKRFYRFIQEGTWQDDKYTDDDKYYSDAISTAANSALPKVTYTFDVIDIGQIPDYEKFEFDLGDKTWAEDSELFGDGREEVVITEITYEFDEPNKTSVKIQNHKDQFSSLFQKITATTQSVQYAAGQWNKAADFASANPVDQAAFLQQALVDAEMKLQNAGDQSVVWGKTGIIVTDLTSPNEQIRIIGGAIMLRNPDGDGLGWTTAITAKGINAKIINTGTLNTGNVTIMYGDEPYFRWDAFGITAYHFGSQSALEGGYLYGLDTSKGVRFDRFGIYGYNGVDGATWHPNTLEEAEQYAQFALTWDGLYLNCGSGTYKYGFNAEYEEEVFLNDIWHSTKARLGKAGKYIYNTWYEGKPSYNDTLSESEHPFFVKVMSIMGGDEEQFALYDDGTLVANNARVRGTIYATKGSIGGWEITNNSLITGEWSDSTNGPAVCLTLPSSWNTASDVFFVRDIEATDSLGNYKHVYPFRILSDGQIIATKGKIGGCTIDSAGIYSGSDESTAGVGVQGQRWAFWAGGSITSTGTAKFVVGHDGSMKATLGSIGGWTISTDGLFKGDSFSSATIGMSATASDWAFWAGHNQSNGTTAFRVTSGGEVNANNLQATGGKIGNWNITGSFLGTSGATGAVADTVFISQSGTGAYVNATSTILSCVFYSKGNFAVDTNGRLYASGATISGSGTFTGTIRASEGYFDSGCYVGGNGSTLQIYSGALWGSTIYTGLKATSNTSGFYVGDDYSWFMGPSKSYLILNKSQHLVYGTETYAGALDIYCSGHSSGNTKRTYITSVNYGLNVGKSGKTNDLIGNWWYNGDTTGNNGGNITTSSDERIKTNIQNFSESYEKFYDNIIPKSYKYINGNSNRTHSGFIAQQVLDSLCKANLTTQDFAGFCLYDKEDSESLHGLLYEEFIALNTWQIQKLKPRMTAAEQEILQLKSEVESLRAELENLKNS